MEQNKADKTKKIKKIILSKYGIKHGSKKWRRVAWEEGDQRYISFYSGEFLNGKPHGQGFYEKYFSDSNSNTYKLSRFDNFWKKYSKHSIHKSRGYFLFMKYTGEWKFGKREGHCEYTNYAAPYNDDTDIDVNRYGSPIILDKKIGNFKNNKEHGKFEIFTSIYGWDSINYKNGRVIGL